MTTPRVGRLPITNIPVKVDFDDIQVYDKIILLIIRKSTTLISMSLYIKWTNMFLKTDILFPG